MKQLRDLLAGRPRVTLPPAASALEAARAMTDHQVGAVLVCSPDDRPLGIFTERDLMARVIVPGIDPRKVSLERVMTREMLSGRPEHSLTEMAFQMQSHHVRHLPVIDQGRFVGMLSLRDILRELLSSTRAELREITAYIQTGEVSRGDAAADEAQG